MEDTSQWRLQTSSGIPYRLVNRSGSFSYEGAEASEVYIIAASDLLSFVTTAFPEPYAMLGTLYYPQQPVMPGLGTLVPTNMTWKPHVDGLPCDPFGADTGAPSGTYQDYIEVTIDYGLTPSNDQQPEPNDPFTFLEVSANASGVFLSSPLDGANKGRAWELPDWVVEGDHITGGESSVIHESNIPFTVTETQVEWTIRWPSIPFSFWSNYLMARLREKLGTVNSSPMGILHNAPMDTILFLSYSASTSFTWRAGRTGQNPIQLQMNFLEKNFQTEEDYNSAGTLLDGSPAPDDISTHTVDVTHQHMWRPTYGWRKLQLNGKDLYRQTDLNKIWEPT